MKVFRQSLLLITFTLFSFDVFADSDGDGLPDENDPCPQIDGRYSSESSGTNPDISRFEFCASEGASGPVLELFIEVSDSFSDTTNASFLYWYVNNKQTWINISREDSSQPFRASVELHPNAASGTYAVRAFTIKDNDDLELSLNEGQLNDLGFLTQTVLTNPEADNKVPEIASFASDGWSFDSEGNPQLKATVVVVEDGSGVVENTLILELLSPTGASLQTRSDSFQDNTANFTLTLSKYAASGIYPVNTVRFSDYAGNNQMSQAWLQENPKVFELENPLGDQEAPELLAFKLSATFDNSSNRPVIQINGTAYDPASQVDGVYLRLNRPSGGILDKWVKDRANKETLEFSNQIPLTTEFQSGTYEVGFLRLNDVAENTVRFVKADIADLGEEFSTELNVYFPGEEEVSKGQTKVVASGKSDFVFGANESDDVIEAGEGNDEIYTGSGDDDVDAGPGDDTITGGSGEGDDIYNGGAGSDRVVYTSSTLGVVVDLEDGTASGSEIGADTLISIENVVGGLGPDTFTFNEENNTILGEGGDDKFFNLEMLGVDVAFGGEGSDSFYWSGQGSFTLSGDAGRDTFYPEELVEKGKVVIKDFDTAEGDVLVLASLLPTLGNAWSDLKGGLASVSEVLTLDQENGFHSLNLSESYRDESGKILVADIYGLSEAPELESILDTDGDGIGDSTDNCEWISNANQSNFDADPTGDACDFDDDNDGFSDEQEAIDGTNPLSRFSCKSGCFSFDVDENLEAQPLTDGLLVIRHLFGFSGDSLTSGAVSGEANRDDSDSIASYLTDADSQLDIDGDGESKPLTDGLLLIRYLFGFSGDSLISGAIGSGAERDTAEEVEAYILERVPAL
jgi:Ca2+-binding RTX toxin-like protein